MASRFQPAPGDRQRDDDGTGRKKRRDTLVDTLRETYPRFAPGRRSDTTLGRILDDANVETLDQYFKKRPRER
jgi:hypothetical protein